MLAQSGTSSLRGVVTDPSGASVAGAKVLLKNAATSVERTVVSGQRGEYLFTQMPPGRYAIAVQAAGFAQVTHDGVQLLVDSPATLNIVLTIGTVESAVEVNGGATALNTSDATLGNPFDARQILTLPSEGRNAVELLSLQAGVTYLGTNTDAASDSRSGAVHGARSDQTNITVDGLDNNDQLLGTAFTGVLRMPMDSLEEFRVTTSNANADAGRSSARSLVRAHRLWESYLDTHFDLPRDHLHEAAERMEHYLGEKLQEELAAELADRQVDPHGKVIPPAVGS